VWDPQTKIRLRLGPLDQAEFLEFQPGRPASSALRSLLELCCGQALSCDVVLVLRKETVPPSVMDSRSPAPMSLGISTWIRTTAPDQDLEDAKFRLL
jgi:type VI secretion system protein ImpH